ncbi:MAG: minor capsid protein [Oscillospiraceae bacterium]|jgi:SPP1 gp7 family putative phage head morphogenesis protein|nr:minor capsid protein [Oscillospiraceae bacterium]
MNNAEYWARRMVILHTALEDRGLEYIHNLETQFDRAAASIERDISVWYQRYADNNAISYAEARKRLTAGELKEFRWSVKEYIRRGQESALDGRWVKELENASARMHISRLDALKLQLQQQAEVLHGGQLDGLDALLRRTYADGFYQTAFEVQRGIGTGWTLHGLNEGTVGKALSRPWTTDGRTFSGRIWANRDALVRSVNTHLTQAIIRGDGARGAIDAVMRDMRSSKSNAARLVMTESAALASAAQKDCFNTLGVERYVIVATLDSITSDVCRDLDGKVFRMPEYAVGVTAPPFHPWCRTCTAPWFEDMAGLGERASRDPATGKTVTDVPKDMKYPEWKEKYVTQETLKKPYAFAIIGVRTSTGAIVQSVAGHFEDSMDKRGFSIAEVIDALEHPLHVTETVIDARGRPSQQFIGVRATVVYNSVDNTAVTGWLTGEKRIKKYGGVSSENTT